MTGNLGRRLTALEEIAEQVRRREVRNLVASLPDAHDLTPAELEEATDEAIRALDDFAEHAARGQRAGDPPTPRRADRRGVGR